ncbi:MULTISPECIES: heat-inducible transcriptional repressor HrcA [Kocuria]|uniref:heat-inducible transcriptional repressor HrcA n=1 Tax=Kocuria TaxID=57493 RepID=UPI000F88D750|nr:MULTISPECIES: heat-inducible transcriptional repressor HrcA [unclassified Kocuria]RUP83471.1 heat-inducible transcriptional repressor HrcA [Kocuria sp. HSID17590]RUQ12034.1 heat-inducible transcriptional repressor HrcA [Kocuria sp. HSID17582]
MEHPRRAKILQAIVEDYVHSREPVGSKALVERHRLPVSSATVRNDMAALEEDGLIVAPHTSSGRIPTDRGYRVFVGQIAALQPLTPAQRRAVQVFLDGAHDIDDAMERTVRLLAQLTHQVAVIQYPVRTGITVRHVELVDVGGNTLLVVLIPTSGRVVQRTVALTAPVAEDALLELRAAVLARVLGQALETVPAAVAELPETVEDPVREAALAVADTVAVLAAASDDQRLVRAGTANLARFSGDFPQSISPVLEALEEQVTLLRLLSEMQQDERGVAVRIGSEQYDDPLAEAAVVATGYGPQDASKVGVVGPTRMDYPTTMASVRAVARYLSKNLGD